MLQNQPATAWSKGTTERSACSTNGNPPELAMVRGDFDLSLAWPLGDLAGFIQRDPDAPASALCHSARGRATWLPPSARTSPTSTQRSRRLPRLLSTHEPTSDSKPWRVGAV